MYAEKIEKKNYQKIFFRLEKDSDGYPPDDWESLWSFETDNGLFSVDNIPFYVRDVSLGDVISVEEKNGELFFKRIEKLSGRSVLRVIVYDEDKVDELRKSMNEMGCDFEGSRVEGFTAFDVPPDSNFDEILAFLKRGEDDQFWGYEEASIRHE